MSNNVHIFNSTLDESRYNKEQVHSNFLDICRSLYDDGRYACIDETKSKRSKSIELSDVCVFSKAK